MTKTEFESLGRQWAREAKLEATALDEEAKKYRQYTFYFCGKINHTDWRHTLLNLRSEEYPLDDYRAGYSPVVHHGLGAGLHYGGPFFVACDHGCYHGDNSHGVGRHKQTCEGGQSVPSNLEVVANSQISIATADIVFAWLDDLTAYGSFAELGFASALRKQIWIAWPKPLPDLWFIQQMATATVLADTAKLAFHQLLFSQLGPKLLLRQNNR